MWAFFYHLYLQRKQLITGSELLLAQGLNFLGEEFYNAVKVGPGPMGFQVQLLYSLDVTRQLCKVEWNAF